MKSKERLERELRELEDEMTDQSKRVMKSGEGWGGPDGLFWDKRCIRRETLRWVLGLKSEQFNAADTMAGW